jgi:hypothetical protein
MTSRNKFSSQERAARSRLTQVAHAVEFICGSVVSMARQCGKKGCHCVQGEKHVSLYLSVRMNGRRRMVYIPPELEETVRQQVALWRESERLMEEISAACLQRVFEQKRSRKNGEDKKT